MNIPVLSTQEINFLKPFEGYAQLTQSYQQHVQRAINMGCCYMPGSNCSCWYYGGLDWGMNKFPILASQYGQVVRVQDQGKSGYGKHVRMSHLSGSWTTIYAHLDSWNVTEGQMVEPGTVIGISGNTGNSTGPHLHWEVRENDKPVDPMPLM